MTSGSKVHVKIDNFSNFSPQLFSCALEFVLCFKSFFVIFHVE